MQCTIQKRKTTFTLAQVMPLTKYLSGDTITSAIADSDKAIDYMVTFKDAANNYFTHVITLTDNEVAGMKIGATVNANILVVYDEANRSPRTIITNVDMDA